MSGFVQQGSRRLWSVLSDVYDQFFEDHCPSRAASLAYATLLSLVPLMIVAFYILSWFPVFHGTGKTLQKLIVSNFVAGSAVVITQYLNQFLSHMRDLSLINIVFLAVASILLMYNMVGAFNSIWHVKMKRHFALSFMIYLLVLLCTPLLFGAMLLIVSYFSSLPLIKTTSVIEKPLYLFFPYLVEFFVFSFFNWVLPSTKVRLRYALFSGFVTLILFECAKYGFLMYLRYVPTYRLVYGALSTIPLFLVWLYVSWLIILIGALVCYSMTKRLPSSL